LISGLIIREQYQLYLIIVRTKQKLHRAFLCKDGIRNCPSAPFAVKMRNEYEDETLNKQEYFMYYREVGSGASTGIETC
jgi:hypothetical protein